MPLLSSAPDAQKTSLQAFSTHNLPIVEVLVWYFHATAGLPVRNTWFKVIKAEKNRVMGGTHLPECSQVMPHI